MDGTRLPTWLLGPPAESSGLVTKSVKFSLCYAWKFLLLLSETKLTGRICKRYLLFSFISFFCNRMENKFEIQNNIFIIIYFSLILEDPIPSFLSEHTTVNFSSSNYDNDL